jgi:gliding motility-associated lipoprotein GldD
MQRSTIILPVTILITLLASCCNSDNQFPKPSGYFRIDLPEQNYARFDTTFPYSFEYSKSARIVFDNYTQKEPYWLNIYYPDFRATLHLSYKDLRRYDLYNLQEDARSFVFHHASKAHGIRESVVSLPQIAVFGKVYFIEGKDAASPFQFYVTDSINHFIRGALYFNLKPNNDSLRPVINHIVSDTDIMLSSIKWRY